MNRSTPGLPVHHQFLEFTQTHAHRVGDAIQPSHPLSSPFPPAPDPSQHQGLFQLDTIETYKQKPKLHLYARHCAKWKKRPNDEDDVVPNAMEAQFRRKNCQEEFNNGLELGRVLINIC